MVDSNVDVGANPDLGKYRDLLRSCVERISHKYQAKFDESDLVQETLADAQRHLPAFRGRSEAELTNWLRKMLSRNMIDAIRRLRSQKRDVSQELRMRPAQSQSGAPSTIGLRANHTSPSARIVANEQLESLRIAIEALPEAQRTAISLHHLHGMTLSEVAQHMNRSTAAVAGLLHRGLCALQKNVAE